MDVLNEWSFGSIKETNKLMSLRNVKYLLKGYIEKKSKLRLSKFKDFVSGSVFGTVET